MQIICVRHGEACGPEVDYKRPLTENGQAQAERVAAFLAKTGLSVSQLFHSSKLRAQQTAKIFIQKLVIPQVTELPWLGDAEAVESLLDLLPTWNENTMIVGHLPYLPQFINALVLGNNNHPPMIHYPPATAVCLEYHCDTQWMIRWVITPEVVPIEHLDED